MSLENFHSLNNEPIDNSIVKRDFLKIYQQQGAQLNDPNQNIEYIYDANNNYHPIGNLYREFDISVRDPTVGYNKNAETRLFKNGFVFCSTEATIATTGVMEIEHVKSLGQVSTIMRSLTSQKDDPFFTSIILTIQMKIHQ